MCLLIFAQIRGGGVFENSVWGRQLVLWSIVIKRCTFLIGINFLKNNWQTIQTGHLLVVHDKFNPCGTIFDLTVVFYIKAGMLTRDEIKDNVWRIMRLFPIFDEKLVTIDVNLQYIYPDVTEELNRFKILFNATFISPIDKVDAITFLCEEFKSHTGISSEEIDEDSGIKFKVFRWDNMVRYDIMKAVDPIDDESDAYFHHCRAENYAWYFREDEDELYFDEHEDPGFDERTEKFVMELYEQIKKGLTIIKMEIENKVYSLQQESNIRIEGRKSFDDKIHNEGLNKIMKILNQIDKKAGYEYCFQSDTDWKYFSKQLCCFYLNLTINEPPRRVVLNEGSITRFYGINIGIRNELRKGKKFSADTCFHQFIVDHIDHGVKFTAKEWYEKVKGMTEKNQKPGDTKNILKELTDYFTR